MIWQNCHILWLLVCPWIGHRGERQDYILKLRDHQWFSFHSLVSTFTVVLISTRRVQKGSASPRAPDKTYQYNVVRDAKSNCHSLGINEYKGIYWTEDIWWTHKQVNCGRAVKYVNLFSFFFLFFNVYLSIKKNLSWFHKYASWNDGS